MLRRIICNSAVVLVGVVALSAQDPEKKSDSDSHPVSVRYAEGMVHGFLHLSTAGGKSLADGDLLQVPRERHIESRMVFHFADSSYFDERVTFTQHDVILMLSYHLVQHGPAFERDLDARLEANGHYVVKATSHDDGKTEMHEDTLDLPSDVANGLPIILLKNLKAGETHTVHLVAFTPKPRLVGLELTPGARSHVMIGKQREATTEYALKPKLSFLTGIFAALLGKTPPDSHVWIVTEDVPAFVKFEGPLYMGPVWRIELAAPQ
jgi:hypothetical protein